MAGKSTRFPKGNKHSYKTRCWFQFFPKFPPLFEDSGFWLMIFPGTLWKIMASHFLKLFLHIGQFGVSMFSSFPAWVRQNKFRNWYNVDNRSYFLLKSRLPPKKEFETENMIRLCIETIQKPEALWVLGAFFVFLPLRGFAVRLCGRLCRRHGQQSLWRDQNAAAGWTSSVVPWNGFFSILNVSRVGSWT